MKRKEVFSISSWEMLSEMLSRRKPLTTMDVIYSYEAGPNFLELEKLPSQYYTFTTHTFMVSLDTIFISMEKFNTFFCWAVNALSVWISE